MDEILAGMADGADAADAPDLTQDDIERMCDIICDPSNIVGVEPGEQVIVTKDGGEFKFSQDSGGCGVGITSISRAAAVQMYERAFAFDTLELGWMDYSFKPLKTVVYEEMVTYEQIVETVIPPFMYGAMPNMGLYYAPDGQFRNPNDLMRVSNMEDSMEQSELAAEQLVGDMEYITGQFTKIGLEGFDFDTTGSAGDAEFVATLRGAETYRKQDPNANIIIGMSSESILGLHGLMEYKGYRVAGMYPAEQAKMAELSGANVFGAVVNTNSSKSFPWNVARATTIIKKCTSEANIPVHANLGMGVGGIPICEVVPTDTVGRAGKILIELAHIDGV